VIALRLIAWLGAPDPFAKLHNSLFGPEALNTALIGDEGAMPAVFRRNKLNAGILRDTGG
jgi:hypothetical protein